MLYYFQISYVLLGSRRYLRIMIISLYFASVALLQKTDFFQNLQTFAIFNLNSHPEDDIIAKI